MQRKTIVTLSAVALAGLALVPVKRALEYLRQRHLEFDFPIEDKQLFV